MRTEGFVPALAETAFSVDEYEIKWRKRPGLKAVDHLPVVAVSPG